MMSKLPPKAIFEMIKRRNEMKDCCSADGVKNARGLFHIHAVNAETDLVVFDQKVVAEGEKEALYESNMKEELNKQNLTKDDVHILVTEIGPIPAKEKPKVVKLLGKIGDMLTGR